MSALLEDNYHSIQKQILLSAEKAGRKSDAVRLVAVSKKMDSEKIRVIWRLGHRLFGENRVQEARVKIPEMPVGGEWHFIGGLQTNKAKDAVECFDVIESVDRVDLAQELEKRLAAAGKKMRVMLEINVGGEAAKHGCPPEKAVELFQGVKTCSRLEVIGLMAIPPFREDPEQARPFFVALRQIRDRLQDSEGVALPELSMGMSHDFSVAIQEGATLVRIGTALFGPRSP
ncbi:MAG TPA: YggS family pyridoxal phosphate-dependent enzyme [Verrucomicrobia subdivision 6 bacterium]|nr:YggS family pyridoxal phosphate-dependent enzyme [Verrucomicrobia subdivision 6 bacterium]